MSARTPRDELAEATEHGGLYLRRLVRGIWRSRLTARGAPTPRLLALHAPEGLGRGQEREPISV